MDIREEHSLNMEEGLLVPNGHGSANHGHHGKKKPELAVVVDRQPSLLRAFMANFCEVVFGTKLAVLFPALPLAFIAHHFDLGRPWIFTFSLVGLAPLAERISFLTEQIAYYTGPTVGGLMNATCGNATELIIAILALYQGKIHVLKYTLLGSILSNLLLVLGSALLLGGFVNLNREQKFDKRRSNVDVLLLSMGVLCHLLPLLFRYGSEPGTFRPNSTVQLSRASGVAMLVAYFGYLFFQLMSHDQVVVSKQGEAVVDNDADDDDDDDEKPAIGFWSAFAWLVGMTLAIALLSEYIVGTIEDASSSWGISVSFLSIILLPILGNAAEHAGALIFACKNKLDISLGVALGSATQISMFVVPFCVIFAWMLGVNMDLDIGVLESGSLTLSIIISAFVLQDGTSHYMKGAVLLLCYVVISFCFLVEKSPNDLISRPLAGLGY